QVLPPEVEEAVVGELAEPQAKTERRFRQIVIQPAEGLQLGFLHHVRRVQPRAESGVGAQRDKATQKRPMPGKEPLSGLLFTVADLLEQVLRLSGIACKPSHGVL